VSICLSSESARPWSSRIYCLCESPPAQDRRGFDLISDALPFGRLWYAEPNAISYAKFYSRSHNAVIRVYDESRNVIDTHEQTFISSPGF
jgi:hypothetical protein